MSKRGAYNRRADSTDRRHGGVVSVLGAMSGREHLQALAELDRAYINGSAKPPEATESRRTARSTRRR